MKLVEPPLLGFELAPKSGILNFDLEADACDLGASKGDWNKPFVELSVALALPEGAWKSVGFVGPGTFSDVEELDVEPLLIALPKMLEVFDAGGLAFGVVLGIANAFGFGVAGVSSARCLFVGDPSRSSRLTSASGLRFTDKLDSLPVMPFSAAFCFLIAVIWLVILTVSVKCHFDSADQSELILKVAIFVR
jgi:hypothetical protein